jgi:hypothetical protein
MGEEVIATRPPRRRPDVSVWAPALFARFSAEDVRSLRTTYRKGTTYRELAAEHGCQPSTIRAAVLGIGAFYRGIFLCLSHMQ